MRILIDYHHFGLCRSLFLTLCGRLGYEVHVPDGDFAADFPDTEWGPWGEESFARGGFPDRSEWPAHGAVSFEEFCDTSFDVLLCSRTEAQETVKMLRKRYQKNAKLVAQAGNEGTRYDWRTFRNLLSSDAFTHEAAPRQVHKLLYSQELGAQFCRPDYVRIDTESSRRVGCYVNGLSRMQNARLCRHDYASGRCPYCLQKAPPDDLIDLPAYWRGMEHGLHKEGIETRLFGFDNVPDRGENLDEEDIPPALEDTGLTFHFKMHEGYGHALCQSVSMGRPVVVPRGFFAFRTARRYLIPNLTCFEVHPFDCRSAVDTIAELCADPDWLDATGYQCWKTARTLFDWEWEARRVGRFLEDLS